jgi:hypothetical protein
MRFFILFVISQAMQVDHILGLFPQQSLWELPTFKNGPASSPNISPTVSKHFAASSLPEQSLSHAHGFQSNQSRVILQLGLQSMTESLSIKFYSL